MKEGYSKRNANFINKARKVIEFFVKKCQADNGLFFNLYDVERKSPSFWWVGLFMPLNYVKPNELEYYMGPIMKDEYLNMVVTELSKKKGCYLRSMSEEAYALLLCYETERLHGLSNEPWLKAAIKYGNFLLRAQNTDGSWNRAYDLEGKEMTRPERWAGTDHERKADTATVIPFLIKLYELTNEHRYLDAALKAGDFVLKNYVETCEICSGHQDSPYTKGTLITNESAAFTLEAMLYLYELTGQKRFLDGAIKVGKIYATWIYIWDVPFPKNTTLHRYRFRSTGWGACDNCGAGYIHQYSLFNVRELLKLAELTKDEIFFTLAKLIASGQQQMLSSPANMFGFPFVGIQEEGRFTGWLLIDDPIWQDRKMGGGRKGEGNKTCFGWQCAVSIAGAHKVMDEYGTLDFNLIHKEIFRRA